MKFFENSTRIYTVVLLSSLCLISWFSVTLLAPVMSVSWLLATTFIAGLCCERIAMYFYRHYLQNACIKNIQVQNALT
jgi:hypothetical protein